VLSFNRLDGAGDPELVGEFLQCLKLLGIDEWQDADIWYV
jgi:hypothetical protein